MPGRFGITRETVALPDGRVIDDYWQIAAGDYVVVFAHTASGKAICLREYRHGARRVGMSLVAGQIENGEKPQKAGRRELLEETGYVAQRWRALGSYVISSSQGSGRVHFLYASGARFKQKAQSGDLESPELLLLTRAQLLSAMRRKDFLTADHLAAIGIALLT